MVIDPVDDASAQYVRRDDFAHPAGREVHYNYSDTAASAVD